MLINKEVATAAEAWFNAQRDHTPLDGPEIALEKALIDAAIMPADSGLHLINASDVGPYIAVQFDNNDRVVTLLINFATGEVSEY